MNIAVITNVFPAVSETFILRQITGLRDLGHTVTVISEFAPGAQDPVHADVARYGLLAHTHYANVPSSVHRVLRAPAVLRACLRTDVRATSIALDASRYGRRAAGLANLYRLSALLAEPGKFDVIHAHFGNLGDQFRFARQACRVPLVVSFHGYDFSYYPRLHGQNCYRGLFRDADLITANSAFTQHKVQELGCPPEKIVRLPVSVDLQAFQCAEHPYAPGGPVRLLTVARLTEKKGVEYSIRAVARLLPRFPALRYDVIGDGHLRPHLQGVIEVLGVADAITLHGAQDSAYVVRMMRAAHLFVLASVTDRNGDQEGQGLVLQEAQACGLPVLATDHGPFVEGIVPGQSGVLVPERDVDALAGQLENLLRHPDAWPEMGRCGRRYVETNFNSEILNQQLVEAYERAKKMFRRATELAP